MRLLSVETHQLESYEGWDTVPPYAILSHTWEEGEVLFHDISNGCAKEKQGWGKILGACAEAEKLGIFYLINSMFAWYRDARVCFAYLGDLVDNGDEGAFDKSKFWTRGWTLQELIAPTEVMFFRNDWSFIDLRSSLAGRLAEITGVAEEILRGGNLDKLHDFSIASKFSWAAKRRTTRGEDRAYSLMGLFGVNMSMIYGEGEQAAFFRLQKVIFEVYADHSIFAWHYLSGSHPEMETCNLLASSISAFESSADIISEPYNWDMIGRPKERNAKVVSKLRSVAKYSAFSHGMRVQLLLENVDDNYSIAYLACRFRANIGTLLRFVVIFDKENWQYRRVSFNQLEYTKIDNYFGNKVMVEDVYLAAPRVEFVLSLRPARYQIASTYSAISSPSPSIFLYLMDDAARYAGFTPIGYFPPEIEWGQSRSSPYTRASPGLRLWHHDKDSTVIYQNKGTAESFAVVIGTSRKFRSEPQAFLVGIVDDIGPDTSAAVVLDDFSHHSNDSLKDLSTQMLVKPLSCGKQVILSVNVSRQQACVSPFTTASFQDFMLWVVVKEARI